ncbi:MAG: hypothetical protein WDM77_09565 [Steroidobacteraceae bacterium]
MPKYAIRRALLRTFVGAAFLIGAILALRGLIPQKATPAPAVATRSAATPPTPVRAAATAATAAAARAVTPSELSTIRVIVSRNDTLDHIFRRLALSLSDLASLRSLPAFAPSWIDCGPVKP